MAILDRMSRKGLGKFVLLSIIVVMSISFMSDYVLADCGEWCGWRYCDDCAQCHLGVCWTYDCKCGCADTSCDSCSYSSTCDESGTKSCTDEYCDSYTETCTRDTDGDSCDDTEYGNWGSCVYDSTCDESGVKARSKTVYKCSSGSCSGSTSTETTSCSRDTDGDSCGTTDYGSWSSCSYSSTCDESGTKSRSVTTYECSGGSCTSSTSEEDGTCTRDTDGDSCGSTTYGMWSDCEYSSTCDESGSQWRAVIKYTCSGGSCKKKQTTQTRSCSRDTDGDVCGEITDDWSKCSDCVGIQSQNVYYKLCSSGSCSEKGDLKKANTRDCTLSDGEICDTDTVCMYSDTNVCDEVADMMIYYSICESGACTGDGGSERRTNECTRDTDGDSCGNCGSCVNGVCDDSCEPFDECGNYVLCNSNKCGEEYPSCTDAYEKDGYCYWDARCCACFQNSCEPCNGYGWCSYNYRVGDRPSLPSDNECCKVNCVQGGWDQFPDDNNCDPGEFCDSDCKCEPNVCESDSDCGACMVCDEANNECVQADPGTSVNCGPDQCVDTSYGCEYREYYCNEQGSCVYDTSDYHEDYSEWTSCYLNYCGHSGTHHDFYCEGADCADHTSDIDSVCSSNRACSSDSYDCIFDECGTKTCEDVCIDADDDGYEDDMRTYTLDSCNKYCDGNGNCMDCDCSSAGYIDSIDDPLCGACSDSDGGNHPKTGGICNDGSEYNDTCGTGDVLTEYYCSNGSCVSTTKDCDDYDNYYCQISGTSLYRKFKDWDCSDMDPDKCTSTTSTKNTYTCDSSNECTEQTCENTLYKCHYSNSGSYSWVTSYPSSETACSDNHDNDCDGLVDEQDSDCGMDGCTAGECSLVTRQYCISDDNWSDEDSSEYCNNCDHCNDETKNCDEEGIDCGGSTCPSCEDTDPDGDTGSETFEYSLSKGWNMISSPYNSITLISDECGAYSNKFYHYDSETGNWKIDTVGIENIEPGKGYWFYTTKSCDIVVSGSDQIWETDIRTSTGWNYVGSPMNGLADIGLLSDNCLDCVDGICDTLTTKWYNPVSKTWDDVTTLEKGKGYILKCED